MWLWSKIRTRVLLVPLVPAVVLAVVVGFDLHRSVGVVLLAAAAVVVGFAVAIVVARSITRPLRDLATIVADTYELRVAEGSAAPRDDVLPPRYIHSASPLSELAIAVAEGRRRAAAVVVEQRHERRSVTDLIANLALRNERLLGAALDALGEIARRDHEPATAAAIARVHRIVARVDRSTASALVLIGEGGRVAPYPASITDVVWAAALAIESSDRVDAVSMPLATLHADLVADVAHLLAEIIDNAVAASPAPGRVTVLGAPNGDGGYEITVLDAGSGMAAGDIELANERVRRLEVLHRVPTRQIGLDVVGRLARRHGIAVRLGESAEGGVVVRVLLPPALLTRPVAPEPEIAPEITSPGPTTWMHSSVAGAADSGHAAGESEPVAPSPVLESWRAGADPASLHHAGVAPTPTMVAQEMVVDLTAEPATVAPVALAPVALAPVAPVVVPAPVVQASAPVPVEAVAPVASSDDAIEWTIDLTAMERPAPVHDELLPKRDQRKWAAAIARARG